MKNKVLFTLNDDKLWLLISLGIVFTITTNFPQTGPYALAIFLAVLFLFILLVALLDRLTKYPAPDVAAEIKKAIEDAGTAVFSPDDFKLALQQALADFVAAQNAATKALVANTAATNTNTSVTIKAANDQLSNLDSAAAGLKEPVPPTVSGQGYSVGQTDYAPPPPTNKAAAVPQGDTSTSPAQPPGG